MVKIGYGVIKMKFKKIIKKIICSNLVLLELFTLGVSNNVAFAGETTASQGQPGGSNTSTSSWTKRCGEYCTCTFGQALQMAIAEGISHGIVGFTSWGWDYVSTNIWPSVKSYFSGNEPEFKSLQDCQKNLESIINETSPDELYGQEKAKEKMFSYVMGSLCNIEKLNRDPKSVKNVSGNVIYLLGPSGCGKSTMAKAVADAILKYPTKTLLFVDPSEISAGKTLDKQLFRTLEKKDFSKEDKNYGLFDKEQKAPILEHIDNMKQAVVIIDDYDKMKMMQMNQASNNSYNEDDGDIISEDRTADEILKAIAENGKYYVDGNEIDCRKVIFLITSNETEESLKKNFGVCGSTGGGIQRLKIVKFDSLSFDACKKIIKRMVCRLTKELTDTKGPFKLKNVKVDDQSIDNMAKDIYNDTKNQGRLERTLYSDMMALFSRNVGRESGKSFKVTYKSATDGDLVGSFKKICG